MDSQTIVMIVLLSINVVSSLLQNMFSLSSTFLKSIKSSECCGSHILFKNNSLSSTVPDFKINEPDKNIEVIVERLRKSLEHPKKNIEV